MILVVADASVLVGELLRKRGRALVSHSDLRVVVPEHQWQEAEYELPRRIDALVTTNRLSSDHGAELLRTTLALAAAGVVEVVPAAAYSDLEAIARDRVPRDPNDWPVVALAITLAAGILTVDKDFLGCGCPTWTVETLRLHGFGLIVPDDPIHTATRSREAFPRRSQVGAPPCRPTRRPCSWFSGRPVAPS